MGKIKDVNINLIAPYTSKNGKLFYFLDLSGDNTNQSDEVSHEQIKNLFNHGNNISGTESVANGVDNSNSLVFGGYTLVIPSKKDLLDLYESAGKTPPPGWSDTNSTNWQPGSGVQGWVYWSSTVDGGQNVVNLYNGNYYNSYKDTMHPKNLAVQILGEGISTGKNYVNLYSVSTQSQIESNTEPVIFKLNRDGDISNSLVVNFSFTGSAASFSDIDANWPVYSMSPWNDNSSFKPQADVLFDKGISEVEVKIYPKNNSTPESNESIGIQLSSNDKYILGANTSLSTMIIQ